MTHDQLAKEAITLLQSLIRIQSYSGEEQGTGDHIEAFFKERNIPVERLHNNIIVRSKNFDSQRETVILNSHHDTVKIGEGWTQDPLGGYIIDGKIFGRGSNDAGGCLVSLIMAFIHFWELELPFNIMLVASGEEENFGPNGVSAVLDSLDFEPALGIIGEPTEMHLGIAEKGLIVIDGYTQGVTGHAARDLGVNALYLATEDVNWIKSHNWLKDSAVLGKTKTTVTQMNSGSQHNVIPDSCHYVIDCRVNENYSLQEVLDILDESTHAELKPRSLRWHPSGIDLSHPVVKQGLQLGRDIFGSPTLSDQVHFDCPTVKIGPGRSERSHTSDEFVTVSEIEVGVSIYTELIRGLIL